MTRYLRLGYLIPRLVLLVLLFCLAEFGSGWALQRAVTQYGQQAVGAKVDVGKTAVSVLEARATIDDLRVANPQRPMENLFEAERITLDFESDSLLRCKAIVDRGVVRGLRLGSPRETSGALNPEDLQRGGDAPAWLGAAEQSVKKAADGWVEELKGKLSAEASDFESVGLAEELAKSWPAKFRAMADEARTLQSDVDALRQAAVEAKQNPLRHAELLRTAPAQAKQLRDRLASLNTQLKQLPDQVALDRQRVDAARQRDEQRLRERLQLDQLDPQSLTTQLLGDQITGSIQELIGWVRWSREAIPSGNPKRATTERSRGVDVHFVGVQARPDLLIRRLELAGTARLAGSPVELTGVVTDLTMSPALHGEPMRVALTTAGAVPMEIRATIDRTGPQAIDELLVDCPAYELPAAQLGSADGLLLAVPDGVGALSVSLRIEDQRVEGDVQLVQQPLALTAQAGASAELWVRRLAEGVQARLNSAAGPATRVTLSGTLDEPRVAIWSTLGPAIAESVEIAARDLAQQEAASRVKALRGRLDGELAALDRYVSESSARLGQDLIGPGREMDGLASGLLGGSLDQLGSRIPYADSLFK